MKDLKDKRQVLGENKPKEMIKQEEKKTTLDITHQDDSPRYFNAVPIY